MKGLFVYDHVFIVCQDKIYSSGAFHFTSWERYLAIFDRITVVGQKSEVSHDVSNLNLVSHPRVDFYFVDEIKSAVKFLRYRFIHDYNLSLLIKRHDAVIVRMYSEWGLQAVGIAKKQNKPLAIEVVGCPWDAFISHPSIKAKLLAPIAYWSMRKAINHASHVLYVTDQFLQKRYPTNGYTMGASNVMVTIEDDDILLKRLKKITDGNKKITFGVIGKVDVKAKGIPILLKALSIFKSKRLDFELKIIGPGDNNELLKLSKKLDIMENISFLGKVSFGAAVYNILDEIDIYVHPSKQEGLPRSIIEAMSRACPVLASSIAGTPELLDKKYLHKPGDFKRLAAQIITVAQDEEEMKKMSELNYYHSKKYSSSKLKEKRTIFFHNFYSSIQDHK